jgi:hypothetical protein
MANPLSTKLAWELANPKWASSLNPLLALPLVNGQQLDGIILVANKPQNINHSLGQLPKGWYIVDINAAATVYRTQPFNDKTITLESSANATISIWIY